MTEENPTPDPQQEKGFVERRKKKRTRKQIVKHHFIQAIGSANAMIMFIVLALLFGCIALRFGATTEQGKKFIVEKVNGMRVGPIGNLYVDGLSGDIFTEFTLKHASIKDEKGVWIEGRDFEAKLNLINLITTNVHIKDVKSEEIKIYRRPVLRFKKEKKERLPVSVNIDNINAAIVTYPEFSVVKGNWAVAGKLKVKHNKDVTVLAKILNINRPKDGAKVEFKFKDNIPLFFDIEAYEGNGGALAGMLGLDVNKPLFINIKINEKKHHGIIDVFAKSGNTNLAFIKGDWSPQNGKINGDINLGASFITNKWQDRFGSSVKVNSNWNKIDNNQNLSFNLDGINTDIKGNGIVNFKTKKTISPIKITGSIINLDNIIKTNAVKIGNLGVAGNLEGKLNDFDFNGQFQTNYLSFDKLNYKLANGPIGIKHSTQNTELSLGVNTFGGTGNGILAKILGTNPKANLKINKDGKGDLIIQELNLDGFSLDVKAKGARNLFGQIILNGGTELNLANISDKNVSGIIFSDFTGRQDNGFILNLNGTAQDFATKINHLNQAIGTKPKISGTINIQKGLVSSDNLKLYADEFEAIGQTKNGFKTIIGNINTKNTILKPYGMAGEFKGGWQLAFKEKSPWPSLLLDMKSGNFIAPNSKLQEIIGTNPNIKTLLDFSSNGVEFKNAELNGAKSKMIMLGTIGSKQINLNGNWNINGPNNLGPLEILGNLSGQMNITGNPASALLNINSRIPELMLAGAIISPANFDAYTNLGDENKIIKLNLLGQSNFGNIIGRTSIHPNKNGLDIRDINLNGGGISLIGSAQIPNNNPVQADIDFNLKEGAFLASGVLNGRLRINNDKSNINISGNNFALRGGNIRIAALNINGNGSLEDLKLNTNLRSITPMALSYSGTNTISYNGKNLEITSLGSGNFDGRGFTINKPIIYSSNANNENLNGQIILASQSAKNIPSQGNININASRKNGQINAKINTEALSLNLLQKDFLGSFTGNLNLEGMGSNLEGNLSGAIRDVRSRGVSQDLALNGNINAQLKDSNIKLKADITNTRGLDLDLNIALPALASSSPLRLAIDRTKPLSGNFRANGEIRPLADLVFAGQYILSGNINSKGDIEGTINRPIIIGDFALKDGFYRDPSLGLALTKLNLGGNINREEINIINFAANDNKKGEIAGDGKIIIGDSKNSNFNIRTHKFRLLDNDTSKLDATANVRINASANSVPKLTGDIRIDFAEFSPRVLSSKRVSGLEVEEINIPQERQEKLLANNQTTQTKSRQQLIDLDVNIKAQRGVFVRGSGLNLELSVDANTKGTNKAPILSGVAKVYRGEYEYGGRSFIFDDNGIIYLSSNPNNIRLNLIATRQETNLTAKITATGTAADPKIVLSSVPNLPQDEILAQVLFGRSRAQLSSLESVQLAASLASLASGGGFDVMSNLREITRLDRLIFSNTATGEISVAGGKYLGRDVYIELISEGTQGISSKVEWRPVRSTAIVSQVGNSGDAKVSVRWRRDFK